jgi:hypothetical protein
METANASIANPQARTTVEIKSISLTPMINSRFLLFFQEYHFTMFSYKMPLLVELLKEKEYLIKSFWKSRKGLAAPTY